MRRISTAIALASALVLAGCSGGSGTGAKSTDAEGVAENTFAVAVQNGQSVGGLPGNPAFAIKGGRVTSVPTGIDCGEGFTACNAVFPNGTTVVLTAAPLNSATHAFVMYAGDCSGTACSLEGPADKYVLAMFRGVNDPAGHPDYASGSVHGPAAYAWLAGTAGSLDCRTCHGANLQGVGIALSCKSCHEGMAHIQLDYTTFTSGPSVTAACVKCHTDEAKALLSTNHFTWLGSSTSVGHTTPSSIGKRNVINNFCVANASNESRCMQCHPSYGSAPTKDPATGAVAVNTGPMYLWSTNAAVDLGRIDCLVCHANLGTSKYMKSPAGFGQPWVASSGCNPACSAAQICSATDSTGLAWTDGVPHCRAPNAATEVQPALNAAANSIGAPQRTNCGFCHFNAGGGDNVKMGDLGSALKTPTQAIDVHMGSTASYAPQTCVGCHESGGHGSIKGSGLSIPVDNEGRLTCTDCHSGLHAPDHSAAGLPSSHVDFIACQTCHIPTFSRTQYTKMDWDWQTTADKQACQGLPGCVAFGSLSYPAGNAQTGVIAGVGGEAGKSAVTGNPLTVAAESIQTSYDWKKGIVIWGRGVTPTYRFIAPSTQQQGTHETSALNGMSGVGTAADPYRLSDVAPAAGPRARRLEDRPVQEDDGPHPGLRQRIGDARPARVRPRLAVAERRAGVPGGCEQPRVGGESVDPGEGGRDLDGRGELRCGRGRPARSAGREGGGRADDPGCRKPGHGEHHGGPAGHHAADGLPDRRRGGVPVGRQDRHEDRCAAVHLRGDPADTRWQPARHRSSRRPLRSS